MKRIFINTLMILYAGISFVILCPPEGDPQYTFAWLVFACINFAAIMPRTFRKYFKPRIA